MSRGTEAGAEEEATIVVEVAAGMTTTMTITSATTEAVATSNAAEETASGRIAIKTGNSTREAALVNTTREKRRRTVKLSVKNGQEPQPISRSGEVVATAPASPTSTARTTRPSSPATTASRSAQWRTPTR